MHSTRPVLAAQRRPQQRVCSTAAWGPECLAAVSLDNVSLSLWLGFLVGQVFDWLRSLRLRAAVAFLLHVFPVVCGLWSTRLHCDPYTMPHMACLYSPPPPRASSGDAVLVVVELIATAPGPVSDVFEFKSVGFSALLPVEGAVVPSPASAAPSAQTLVLSEEEAAEVRPVHVVGCLWW